MEGCITDVRKTLVEKLLNKAIEKSRYLFCFTCIVKEFNEEKGKLEAERATMRQHFKVATEKGKDIQSNAEFWEKQVDKLIQENIETKQRYYFGFCPDCIWRYERGEELATKTKVIKSLMEKGEKFENIEITRCLPGVERHSSQYFIPFKSRELKSKELLDALKDDNNYMVGLHGMGGAGKTTLAKEVGKQLRTLEHFKYVIDTTVSFNLEIKKIQNDIAGSLGLEWGEINESDRPKKLWSRLTDGDKILVILDDVWKNLNFDDIGLPSSDNHKGCKVLVTTRELRVCEQMECRKTIQLELLTEEEALIMFEMYADLSHISSKSILGKVREITTLCKRLPIAIAIIARSLKGKKSGEEWDVALNCLKKPVSMGNVEEDLVDVFKCLKFSYDYLNDEKAKGLFLLCSAFPEDKEISVELLTRLGIGVNLFGEGYEKYNDARSQAIVAKNKLLHSCLLLETKKGDVKMHDLVREVAHWIAKEKILVVNLFEKNQKSLVERSKNIKYLFFQGNLMDLCSSWFDGSKLEILIANTSMDDSKDVPTSLFENMAGLRILKLSNTPLSLPKSIQLLINIRSLSVECVILGDISIFGSLQSLETLELDYCEIYEFSPEIAMLKKLRLLSLRDCKIRSNNPFEVIQRCPSLEELYFSYSFNEFCKEITLPTLERYFLTDNSRNWKWPETKSVALERNHLSEATYKYVMKTSYYLDLIRIQGWINLMPEIVPIDEGMNDLIKLHLKEISQLQYLVDTKHINSQVPIVFSKLVVLNLERMEALEELCNGPIAFDSTNNLEKLSIKECENLRSLFKCSLNLSSLKTVELEQCSKLVSVFELSTSQSLPLLEELKIVNCKKLENIIAFERTVTEDTIENSCYSLFPKLKGLHIRECPQLQFILPILSARDIEFLEVIKIKCCDKLKYIFGQHQDVKLTSLKEVAIEDLPNFIDIFPPKASSISKDGSKPQTQLDTIKSNTFSMCCYRYKLKSTKIPSVSEDQPQDCSISLESNSYCLDIWNYAPKVKEIQISNVPKMKSVFIVSSALRMLETFTIEKCDELKQIIIDTGDHNSTSGNNFGNVFPKLKTLWVVNCVQLEYIFGHYNHDHLPPFDKRSMDEECKELKHIIEDDLEDKNFQSSNTFFPKLETLIVTKCDKLKYMFPVSICKEFPELKVMFIREANELEEIFKSDKKDEVEEISKSEVQIPNLKAVGFAYLPSLCHAQEVHFQAVKHRLVHSCQKLSLTSCNIEGDVRSWDFMKDDYFLHYQFDVIRIECVKAASEHKLTSPQLEGSTSEITAEAATVSTITDTKNKQLAQEVGPKQKGIQIYVEEGNTSTHLDVAGSSSGQLVTSECKTSSHEDDDSKKAMNSFSISTKETNDQDGKLFGDKKFLYRQLPEEIFKGQNACDENPGAENSKDFAAGSEVQKALEHQLTSPQELFNEQLMDRQCLINQQQTLAETNITIKPSQEENLEGPTSEITAAATVSTITHEVVPEQKGIEINVEEGNTSANAKKITSSTQLDVAGSSSGQLVTSDCKTSSQEDGDSQIEMTSFSISTTETNDQGSLNHDSFKRVGSNIEEQFPNDDDIIVSKSKPSPSITSLAAYQLPLVPCKEDPCQKVEDLSSLLVKSELEQLVSKNHLDWGNFYLLNDFFVKNPSVRLKDTSLSNRYKGCAYNLLAELLKFLKTHSVLEVLGSFHSEFEELLQDARRFGFDKDWLDGVERRTLCPDMQESQDVLKKLLDSKEHVTKEVEVLRLKIRILSEQMEVLSEHVEVLKHQLTSSQAILESINQQEVALSAPVGY
ncbi:NB-ARC domain disease resistance protein [Medicago truncatula]|uniref:NB-ARC domain disease resistance protein n=1 Tax=Medicago truncatula TaxID=3880 RepID=A0A072V878_MEDTR|nr:NB-ARC domain disease resistance protein [Medicago truncatula]